MRTGKDCSVSKLRKFSFLSLFIINSQPLSRRDFGKVTNPGGLEDVKTKNKSEAKLGVSAPLREGNQTMISLSDRRCWPLGFAAFSQGLPCITCPRRSFWMGQ